MPLCGISSSNTTLPNNAAKSKPMAESQVDSKKRRKEDNCFEITVSTDNSYEPLSDLESMDEDSPPPPVSRASTVKKPERIPPIVVYSYIKDHSASLKALRSACKQDFDLKCRGNRLIFLAKCKDDYKKIIQEVTSAQLEYHTYTLADELKHTLVLRNIPPNVTCEEIKQDLADKNVTPVKITQMSKKEMTGRITKYPLFIVTFDNSVNINEIINYKKVCGCIINWERYKNFSGITQCYKCQSFNHIAKNCYRNPKCLTCAGTHLTVNCPTPDSPPVCVNCNGGHAANHQGCPVLQKHLKARPSMTAERKLPSKPPFLLNASDFPSLPKSSFSNITAPTNSAWGPSGRSNNFSHTSATAWKSLASDNNASDFSIIQLLHEIKSFFSSFNLLNILSGLKNCLERLKQAPDTLSKVSILADFIFNLI